MRLGHGLYQAADVDIEAEHSLVAASRALPHGVVCLFSALQFHRLTTQTPHQVWIMIGLKKWAPTVTGWWRSWSRQDRARGRIF